MQSTQKIKMKHNFFSLILISFAQLFFSQERTAKLKTIQVDGFHQLMISPEIRSASKNNGDVLRIFDSKKNEIPYVFLRKDNNSKSQKSFEIISKNAIGNKLTDVVILNNPDKVFSLAPGYVKPTKNKPIILEPGEIHNVAIQFKNRRFY